MNERITVIFNGKPIDSASGLTLSEITRGEKPCGGKGRCGKCKVIASGALSEISDTEKKLLSEDELSRGYRLACLTYALGNCEVTSVSSGEATIVSDGISDKFTLSPIFKKYGVAIDIGTTTLASKLFDASGNAVASLVRLNPQSAWGADVISRIEAALAGKQSELAICIREALNQMITEMADAADISPLDIDGAVITGNTVMLHLLTDTSPEPLSHAPFKAERLFGERISACELALDCLAPDTAVLLPSCISAFVGADISCAILASGIMKKEDSALLADIGTNGEMALVCDGKLTVCSTAAGPAFEGVGISMGMRGEVGAIDKVEIVNGKLHAHVIGDTAPKGICGSGLIDAVACLLSLEELDETGYLEDDAKICGDVILSQQDIRAVQLAKSAVCAGIEALMHSQGINSDKVSEFYIAGGFGNYLNVKNAEQIGLLPSGFADKAKTIGNAALSGAQMLLLDSSLTEECKKTASAARTLDLASNPVFIEKYTMGMLF